MDSATLPPPTHAVPEEHFYASKDIVPVGFSLGPQHRYVRPADPTPESREVHLGGDIFELSEAEAGVYGTASCKSKMFLS